MNLKEKYLRKFNHYAIGADDSSLGKYWESFINHYWYIDSSSNPSTLEIKIDKVSSDPHDISIYSSGKSITSSRSGDSSIKPRSKSSRTNVKKGKNK